LTSTEIYDAHETQEYMKIFIEAAGVWGGGVKKTVRTRTPMSLTPKKYVFWN
jgi:hypothetical protein